MDTTPPLLVATDPARDTTGVRPDRLTLTFSERLDPAVGAAAVTVAPGFDAPPVVRASGRTLTVVFPDSLLPQATYVVTVGTALRDEHGVALAQPITVAFSTGDRLDRGRLAGRVLDPATGRGVGSLAVAAHPAPADSLGAPPDPREAHRLVYRTETDAEGAFRLDYLRPGPYFVVAFEDRNRNRLVDDGERFAAPPAARFEATEDSAAAPLPDLFVTALDTIPPQLRRVRSLSSSRLVLSFDEAVRLGPGRTEGWALADSLDASTVFPIRSVWNAPERPQDVTILTDALPARPHRLTLTGNPAVADSSGNPVALDAYFTPSAGADTAAVRFAGFLPEARAPADSVLLLRPGQRPGVRFTQPLDSTALRERVRVLGPEAPLAFTASSDNGLHYDLAIPAAPRTYRVEVAGPDTLFVRRYAAPAPDDLGAILGRAEAPGGAPVLVTAYPAEGAPIVAATDGEGRFALRHLPPGDYRLRLVLDRNGNGVWDGGRLAPYEPPETIRWLPEPVRVRARWDTEVDVFDFQAGSSND